MTYAELAEREAERMADQIARTLIVADMADTKRTIRKAVTEFARRDAQATEQLARSRPIDVRIVCGATKVRVERDEDDNDRWVVWLD